MSLQILPEYLSAYFSGFCIVFSHQRQTFPSVSVFVNTRPPRSAVVPGGALDAVNVTPADTSDYCNPPCRGVWNWGVAGRSAPGWPGQRYCPRRPGMVESCRPWSRWRSGCAPEEPRRFCKVSWTWIFGSGTRFSPVKTKKNMIKNLFQTQPKKTESLQRKVLLLVLYCLLLICKINVLYI